MAENGIKIAFTDLLYGVVVANGIYALTLELDLQNVLLCFALAVILSDWIEYQVTAHLVPNSVNAHVAAFGIDVVVLVVWYLLTIVPQDSLGLFFALLSAFFLLQTIWDALLLRPTVRPLIGGSAFQLAGLYGLFAVLVTVITQYDVALLVIGIVCFAVRKTITLRSLIRKHPNVVINRL